MNNEETLIAKAITEIKQLEHAYWEGFLSYGQRLQKFGECIKRCEDALQDTRDSHGLVLGHRIITGAETVF